MCHAPSPVPGAQQAIGEAWQCTGSGVGDGCGLAEVEIGAICAFCSFSKYGYFQKPEAFRLQWRGLK